MEQATELGVSSLTNIIFSLTLIAFTWWVLLRVRIEEILKIKEPWFAFIVMMILSIIIGHQLALFFINYLDWSRMISQYLF
ncbi:DUF1146 family protein [Shimazuella alba]|uniref:DUF1146 domain-containing protein n=1 Tax=Shimazuella alba TaxID=2690964 RepID=A0A6I4VMJ0_9BACL|nr:DUF1146 family protein [Shimazuella alba]MXQ52869.1 DUF1146 domain-containing protein [Shimazuella alba]